MTSPRALAALLLCLLAAAPAAAERRRTPATDRPGRLGFGLGLGVSTAAMDDSVNDAGSFVEAPEPDVSWLAALSLRRYLPYHLFVELGGDVLYAQASKEYALVGEVTNHNLLVEVPVLVGGYLGLGHGLYLHGGVGLAVHFLGRSYWTSDDPDLDYDDYRADAGLGFHAAASVAYVTRGGLALEAEVRYRGARAETLHRLDDDELVNQPDGDPYAIDLSGLGLTLGVRSFY